ncbi:formiminotransferase N-terminal subdomain-containing protein isoform X2 [Lethenteron reissneri]|uniref:formiminotransferase N-terminal subdomain-containing protein isoform X2 n=1 Tax=Lethenteron reissneri TaxID=7753 RepID=UPI002AB6C458|nr:formiminotransferase N-terminal subdomain-containing protein isoform X2 [Lethenteron reissneri]XP_061429933.1 formiminotransferase N-terminal subdomain-containing protein isoform X2 [Lethenteron reissneri]
MPRPLRLAASLLNVSGARDPKVVEAVAWAALRTPHGESLVSACVRACALIDVSAHSGGHPCLGSVDLVPVHPLSDSVGLRECGRVAQAVARELTLQVPGASAFLFGWADEPGRRSLVSRRREWAWYGGPGQTAGEVTPPIPDVGPMPGPRYGIAGVGATPYVMNCNVTIDSTDLRLGRRIAHVLRASSPAWKPWPSLTRAASRWPATCAASTRSRRKRTTHVEPRAAPTAAPAITCRPRASSTRSRRGWRHACGSWRRAPAWGWWARHSWASCRAAASAWPRRPSPLACPTSGGGARGAACEAAAAPPLARKGRPACLPAAPKVYSDCRGRRTLLQSATVLKAQPRNCSLKRRRKGLHEGDLLSVFGLLFHAGGSGSTRSPRVTCRSTVYKLYPETKSTCTLTQRTLT